MLVYNSMDLTCQNILLHLSHTEAQPGLVALYVLNMASVDSSGEIHVYLRRFHKCGNYDHFIRLHLASIAVPCPMEPQPESMPCRETLMAALCVCVYIL